MCTRPQLWDFLVLGFAILKLPTTDSNSLLWREHLAWTLWSRGQSSYSCHSWLTACATGSQRNHGHLQAGAGASTAVCLRLGASLGPSGPSPAPAGPPRAGAKPHVQGAFEDLQRQEPTASVCQCPGTSGLGIAQSKYKNNSRRYLRFSLVGPRILGCFFTYLKHYPLTAISLGKKTAGDHGPGTINMRSRATWTISPGDAWKPPLQAHPYHVLKALLPLAWQFLLRY